MTMRKIKFFMMTTLLSLAVPASAVIGTEDFVVDNLAYHITSTTDRTVEVGLSSSSSSEAYWGSVSEVTIPSTVTYNGTTYRVTKIANYGFTYKASNSTNNKVITITPTADCSTKDGKNTIYSSGETAQTVTGADGNSYTISVTWQSTENDNLYRNNVLKTVNFADDCQIEEIGYLAFTGCTTLGSFQLPASVTTIGPQAFALCTGLKNFEFKTYSGEDLTQYTRIKTIPVYCFTGCTSLVSLYLPEGIEVIQNRALQYCFNLATIHLPNSLKAIGSHFLCEDHAMQSLTIPAGVQYIDGGFFHGCCGLTDVYMLGSPSVLNVGSSSDRNESFGWNQKFGGDAVNDCIIWVYSEWLDDYKTADGWKHFLESSLTYTRNNGYKQNNNQYKAIETEKRSIPDRWVTCCLWEDYTADEVIETFGEGTKVAYMTSAVVDKDGYDAHGAKIGNMYDLTFTVQSLDGGDAVVIRKHTPFMLKSAKNNVEVTVYDASIMRGAGDADEISAEHKVTVEADNGALVQMNSFYPDGDYKIAQWECYFKNPEYTVTAADVADANFIAKYGNVSAGDKIYDVTKAGYMGFYRATMDNFTALKSGRCFWRVVGDPEMTGNGNAKLMVGMTYDVWEETTTGIDNLHVKLLTLPADNVYTLSGQRISNENLPKGIYIVNGKKVMVK